MSPRVVLPSVIWGCFFAATSTGFGQSASQLSEEVKALRSEVAELSQAVRALNKASAEDNALRTEVADLSRAVGELKNESTRLVEVVADQHFMVDAISRTDREGTRIPSIAAIMEKSPEFKQEMKDAVNGSLERTGTLYVSNEMPSEQTLKVNSMFVRIPAYTTNYRIDAVPVGTLTTELVGYERPRNWTIGAPNYQQRIRIAPEATPVYYAKPVVEYRRIIEYPPVIENPLVYDYR